MEDPLIIVEQGGFAVGDTMPPDAFAPRSLTNPAGQPLHGDRASVFYQVPVDPRPLPLVLWPGDLELDTGWVANPDVCEDFQTIFLRRGFTVYALDQPHRGTAGKAATGLTVDSTAGQWSCDQFRLGLWPDAEAVAAVASALFDHIGSSVLIMHPHASHFAWLTAMHNTNVEAVVALEPSGGLVFPEGEQPEPMLSSAGVLVPAVVPMDEFAKLTQATMAVYFDDRIATETTGSRDNRHARLAMATLWVDTVNRHGGDATLVHLPEIGITGDPHFLLADRNDIHIADQISDFLAEKGLD